MLREAELFVMAETMLVEVLGRIRPPDREIVLPPMHPGSTAPTPMGDAVARHLADDVRVPAVLAGRDPGPAGDPGPADEPHAGPAAGVAEAAQAACDAARAVTHGEAVVAGGLSAREFLVRATLKRALLAHYVAAYLGSTACPFPEELARPLWELTGPDAATWRDLGYFREPMPLPPHVSWRDRFLLEAGHEPHPLGH